MKIPDHSQREKEENCYISDLHRAEMGIFIDSFWEGMLRRAFAIGYIRACQNTLESKEIEIGEELLAIKKALHTHVPCYQCRKIYAYNDLFHTSLGSHCSECENREVDYEDQIEINE